MTLENEFEKLPEDVMASDWLNASELMFWMFVKVKSRIQETCLEPEDVCIVEEIAILRFADKEK